MSMEINIDKKDTMQINGEEWVRKSAIPALSCGKSGNVAGLAYCVVRTHSAGVFAGYLQARCGKEVRLLQARRLWYWDGAASLSEMAMRGVSRPENCKFPCPVAEVILTEAVEIIPCTAKAQESIEDVPEWTAHK